VSRLRVVLATGNPGKLRELRAIVEALAADAGGGSSPLGAIELVAPSDLPGGGRVDYPEEGDDYRANALAKARAAAETLGLPALADDSGLEVEALGGAPGPRSARWGGPGLDDRGRVAKLLAALEAVPGASRRARFVCWAAWAEPGGQAFAREGECRGRLLDAPRGEGGFGYDPVFVPEEEDAPGAQARTLAELPPTTKNHLSHRRRAVGTLLPLAVGAKERPLTTTPPEGLS